MQHIGDGAAGRSLVMGILNVTPDSFSDGGLYVDADAAVREALRGLEERIRQAEGPAGTA